jgi:hypothetical protein
MAAGRSRTNEKLLDSLQALFQRCGAASRRHAAQQWPIVIVLETAIKLVNSATQIHHDTIPAQQRPGRILRRCAAPKRKFHKAKAATSSDLYFAKLLR